MDFEDIIYEKKDGIAWITINRPEKRNSLRHKTWTELYKAVVDASIEATIGVIVLTGAGEKAFCSGADQNEQETPEYRVICFALANAIMKAPKPIIASVSGYAIGGGNWLHSICDLTIAADNAIFGQVGPRVGSLASGFALPFQARIVGEKKAREMWMLCEQYSAEEALDMGLVNTVVSLDRLHEETESWCKKLLAKSPTCLRAVKACFNQSLGHLHTADSLEEIMVPGWSYMDESKEGVRAFLEKREPDFSKFRK